MYNRTVRTHKYIYIYEALMRLVWKGFIPCTEANRQHQLDSVTALLKIVSDRRNDMSQEKLEALLNSEELTNSFIACMESLLRPSSECQRKLVQFLDVFH